MQSLICYINQHLKNLNILFAAEVNKIEVSYLFVQQVFLKSTNFCHSHSFFVHFMLFVSSALVTHKNNNASHRKLCADADRGTAALLSDLKSRGMLDDTLVIWGGEFGRTPMAQGTGRDHHINAFSVWMAGGGIRGGQVLGKTDDFGWSPVEDPVHVNDFHATLLHLLGLDHKKLSKRFGGLDLRLTNVGGKVVSKLLS